MKGSRAITLVTMFVLPLLSQGCFTPLVWSGSGGATPVYGEERPDEAAADPDDTTFTETEAYGIAWRILLTPAALSADAILAITVGFLLL